MTIVITDSTILILLAKIDLIDILLEYYTEIYIPTKVFEEVVVIGKKLGKTDAFLIEQRINEKKIIIREISDTTTREKLMTDFNIHLGEAEALVLYFEIKGELLGTDEGKIIDICKIFHIPFFSCLSFILFGIEKNLLPKDQGLTKLHALRKYGWYATTLLDEVELKINTIRS